MILIDISGGTIQELIALLGPAMLSSIVGDAASLARAKWIRLAQTELHSSKRDYIDGIQNVVGDGAERSISLVGWLPNAVEQGIEPFDLRDTLLGSPKAKRTKDGKRYRAIPFRHGTTTSQGQAGAPIGQRYGPQGPQSVAVAASGHITGGEALALGKAIYNRAKRLRGNKRLAKRTMIAVPGNGGEVRPVPLLAPHHTTDIYAGMKRVEKKYRVATQGHYITFRMISDRNPVGWIHPGIAPRQLHRQVEEHISRIIPSLFQTAISAAIGASK